MDHEAVSRRLNAALRGSPRECLCSRLYRNRAVTWPLVAAVDLYARLAWGEAPGHCSRIFMRERLRQAAEFAAMHPDDRLRQSEGQ